MSAPDPISFPGSGTSATPTAGTTQWIRQALLVVGAGGSGLSIGDFGQRGVPGIRIQFEISKSLVATPNNADIRIFNLTPSHENEIMTDYTDVFLSAGYQGIGMANPPPALIFKGDIARCFHYRKDNDAITQIIAGDGDQDYRSASMNLTLSAGMTNEDIINACVASFQKTTLGYVDPKVKPDALIRGLPICGATRHVLRDLAIMKSANWSIQDAKLEIVPTDAVKPGDAVVINFKTGMLSTPEVTDNGIVVTCLLNPQIEINGKIWLDNRDIMQQVREAKGLGAGAAAANMMAAQYKLDPDGIYKVIALIHKGDNRGTGSDWITQITCVALNSPMAIDYQSGEQ